MSYVGNPLATAFAPRVKQDLTGQSGTSFTLSHAVSSPNDLSVYINHVRQEPTTAYTVDYTTLSTTGTVASTDDFYIIFDELALQSIAHDEFTALKATSGTFTGAITTTQLASSGPVSGTTLSASSTTTLQDDVTFTGADYNVVWDKSASSLHFSDVAKATFGDSNDLEIYHNGGTGHTHIVENGTGSLIINANEAYIQRAGSTIFNTTSTGAKVTGNLDMNGGEVILDADDDTSITADTDDQIDLKVGGIDTLVVKPDVVEIKGSHPDLKLMDTDDNNYGGLFYNNGAINLASDHTATGATGQINFVVDGATKAHITSAGLLSVTGDLASSGSGLIAGTDASYASGDADDLIVGAPATYGNRGITIVSGSQGNSTLNFSDANSGNGRMAGHFNYQHQYDEMQWYVNNLTKLVRFSSAGNLVVGTGWLKQTNDGTGGGQFYNGTNITGYNGASFNEFNSKIANEFVCTFKAWNSGTDQEGIFVGHAANTTNDSSNYFRCGNDVNGTKLRINGNGHINSAPGTISSSSDSRIKTVLGDATDQWEDIKAIKFVKYKLHGNDQVMMGVVAQEIEKTSPNLVHEMKPDAFDIKNCAEFGTLYTKEDEDNGDVPQGKKVGDIKEIKDMVKVVKTSMIHTKAVKALQEAMARIETLEAKVKALEEA